MTSSCHLGFIANIEKFTTSGSVPRIVNSAQMNALRYSESNLTSFLTHNSGI